MYSNKFHIPRARFVQIVGRQIGLLIKTIYEHMGALLLLRYKLKVGTYTFSLFPQEDLWFVSVIGSEAIYTHGEQ
jgi:hypothetical protein